MAFNLLISLLMDTHTQAFYYFVLYRINSLSLSVSLSRWLSECVCVLLYAISHVVNQVGELTERMAGREQGLRGTSSGNQGRPYHTKLIPPYILSSPSLPTLSLSPLCLLFRPLLPSSKASPTLFPPSFCPLLPSCPFLFELGKTTAWLTLFSEGQNDQERYITEVESWGRERSRQNCFIGGEEERREGV